MKIKGETKNCHMCNQPIVCNMTNYRNRENKLQWQNRDGTPHYKYDNGNFSCNIPKKTTNKSDRLTKHDYIHCDLCPSQYGWVEKKVGLKEHNNIWHREHQRRTEKDFQGNA